MISALNYIKFMLRMSKFKYFKNRQVSYKYDKMQELDFRFKY